MRALVLALLLAQSSCAFLMVQPPTTRPVSVYQSCTVSTQAPTHDAVGFLPTLLATTGLLFAGAANDDGWMLAGGAVAAAVTLAAIPSAVYGFRAVSRCRRSHAATLAWARSNDANAGTAAGQVCRAAGQACDDGLTCDAGRCRPAPGALGNACIPVRPGVGVGGRCLPGLVCDDGRCQPAAR